MKTFARHLEARSANLGLPAAQLSSSPSSHLHLVTSHDLSDLRDALAARRIPRDLETKLAKLAAGDLIQRFIEQNCRTMLALLLAAYDGAFRMATPTEQERLLHVLAYVRKDEDAVPDYRPDGFLDDQMEVRALTAELNPLLQSFKAWRLRHQVPAMWSWSRSHAN